MWNLNGMYNWLNFLSFHFSVTSLYEACAHAIVNRTTVYGIDRLPLPDSVKQNLKSYALTNYAGNSVKLEKEYERCSCLR